MELITKNGLTIDCTPIKALSNGYMLVFAQDRLCIAKINTAITCKEVESMDIIRFIEGYL